MNRTLSRILYVDDELILRKMTRVALEKLGGFTVSLASSGGEALEVAPEFHPDMILLDVMMPGMDGPATLQELRKRPDTADTPVVFITAKAQPTEISRLMTMGVADVITKPFDPKEMIEVLRRVWERQPEKP